MIYKTVFAVILLCFALLILPGVVYLYWPALQISQDVVGGTGLVTRVFFAMTELSSDITHSVINELHDIYNDSIYMDQQKDTMKINMSTRGDNTSRFVSAFICGVILLLMVYLCICIYDRIMNIKQGRTTRVLTNADIIRLHNNPDLIQPTETNPTIYTPTTTSTSTHESLPLVRPIGLKCTCSIGTGKCKNCVCGKFGCIRYADRGNCNCYGFCDNPSNDPQIDILPTLHLDEVIDTKYERTNILLFLGASGSGKTAAIKNIMHHYSDHFHGGIVFCQTNEGIESYTNYITQHVYQYNKKPDGNKVDPNVIYLDDYIKYIISLPTGQLPTYLILDDLLGVLSQYAGDFQNFVTTLRHKKVTLFLTAQAMAFGASDLLKGNTTGAFLFGGAAVPEIRKYCDYFSNGFPSAARTPRYFSIIYSANTVNLHSCMVVSKLRGNKFFDMYRGFTARHPLPKFTMLTSEIVQTFVNGITSNDPKLINEEKPKTKQQKRKQKRKSKKQTKSPTKTKKVSLPEVKDGINILRDASVKLGDESQDEYDDDKVEYLSSDSAKDEGSDSSEEDDGWRPGSEHYDDLNYSMQYTPTKEEVIEVNEYMDVDEVVEQKQVTTARPISPMKRKTTDPSPATSEPSPSPTRKSARVSPKKRQFNF